MAAQSPSWLAVQAIAPGTEIRVASARVVRGTLQSLTEDSLLLRTSAGQEMFARPQVKRVSIREKGHRGRNTLIGLGVGAGVGLVFGALGDANCGPNCTMPKNFGKEALPPVFGGVGALVGLIIPSGGWQVVYRQ